MGNRPWHYVGRDAERYAAYEARYGRHAHLAMEQRFHLMLAMEGMLDASMTIEEAGEALLADCREAASHPRAEEEGELTFSILRTAIEDVLDDYRTGRHAETFAEVVAS